MSSGDPTGGGVLAVKRKDAWAALSDVVDEEGLEEEPEDEHPGYGSLLGLAPRTQKKKPVLELDPEIAEKAAQVMELNAAALMKKPDKQAQGFEFLGLDPLEAEDEPLDEIEEADDDDWEGDDALTAFAEAAAHLDGPEPDDEPDEVPQEIAESAGEPEAAAQAAEELGYEAEKLADDEAKLEHGTGLAEDEAKPDYATAFAEPDAERESVPPAADLEFEAEPEPEELAEAGPELIEASFGDEGWDEAPSSGFEPAAEEPVEELASDEAPAAAPEPASEAPQDDDWDDWPEPLDPQLYAEEEEPVAAVEPEPPFGAAPGDEAPVEEIVSAEPEIEAAPETQGWDEEPALPAESGLEEAAGELAWGEEPAFPAASDLEESADEQGWGEEPVAVPGPGFEPEPQFEFVAPGPAEFAGEPEFAYPEEPDGFEEPAEPAALPLGVERLVVVAPPAEPEPERQGHQLRARVAQTSRPEVSFWTRIWAALRWFYRIARRILASRG